MSVEWRPNGEAYERVLDGPFECPDKGNPMSGVDGYGRVYWTCAICGGTGSHQSRYTPRFVRRPEFDAPNPQTGGSTQVEQ